MTKPPPSYPASQHPDEESLLRFADGELTPRERDSVRGHLEACWQCRSQFEQLQRTIAESVRYREVLKGCFPPPPSPWCDIRQRISEVDAAPGRFSFWERAKSFIRPPRLAPRWVAATALVVTGVFLFEYLTNAPTVEAAVLLHKAVAASESQPSKPRRVRVRTRRVEFVREPAAKPVRATSEEKAVADMVQRAGYSWENPLDARTFSDWRERLPQKEDIVRHTERAYEIRTATDSGNLIAATLRLSAADLHAIEARLEFRNDEWVEFSELPDVQPQPAVSEARSPDAPKAILPARDSVPGPSASDEVRVFAVLHDLGADLGEPVEVTRTEEDIVVTALSPSEKRANEFKEALAPLKSVKYRAMASIPAAPDAGAAVEAGRSTNPAIAHLQEQLELSLESRASFEQFSNRTLDSSDAVMSRAHALRRLAERFPPQVEAKLDPEARRLLGEMRNRHGQVLQSSSTQLARLVDPVMKAMNGAAPVEPARLSGPWQACVETVFENARATEKHISVLLGGAASEVDAGEIPSRLRQSLQSLKSNAANCTW